MKVVYLPEEEIEAEASNLLKSFEAKHGKIKKYAIPIEEIIECHLGYSFEVDDLDKKIGNDEEEILGYINFDEKLIAVNSKLDPSVYPQYIGRYKYTLAHEVGHDILHKEQVINNRLQGNLFSSNEANQVLCRKADAKESIEWQADCFAGYLLMPKQKIYALWKDITGSMKSLPINQLTSDFSAYNKSKYSEDELASIKLKKLARNSIEVAPISLLIRLKKLGLLVHSMEAEFI